VNVITGFLAWCAGALFIGVLIYLAGWLLRGGR